MVRATFIGEVHKGQLCFGQPLAEFEGKQVLITLIAPDAPVEFPVQAPLVTKPFRRRRSRTSLKMPVESAQNNENAR